MENLPRYLIHVYSVSKNRSISVYTVQQSPKSTIVEVDFTVLSSWDRFSGFTLIPCHPKTIQYTIVVGHDIQILDVSTIIFSENDSFLAEKKSPLVDAFLDPICSGWLQSEVLSGCFNVFHPGIPLVFPPLFRLVKNFTFSRPPGQCPSRRISVAPLRASTPRGLGRLLRISATSFFGENRCGPVWFTMQIIPRCKPWCWNIVPYITGPFFGGFYVGKYSSTMEHLSSFTSC